MGFTVEDFEDLLRLLDERPDWREALRRQVFTPEFRELPALVQEIRGSQARTERALADLAEAQASTQRELAALAAESPAVREYLQRLDGRVGNLETSAGRLETDVGQLKTSVGRLETDVGDLKGTALEQRYWNHGPNYFSPLARRLRVVDSSTLADLLDDAIAEGLLTDPERDAVRLADLVLTGRRLADQAPIYVLVEVSSRIFPDDVERAAERSAVLTKLGRPVIPVVAGYAIVPEAAIQARARGVWQAFDRRIIPPGEPGRPS